MGESCNSAANQPKVLPRKVFYSYSYAVLLGVLYT